MNQEEFRAEPNVIYLRDENGHIYAAVGAARTRFNGKFDEGGNPQQDNVPATILRHKKMGRECSVRTVETMTRQVLVTGDIDGGGEPSRTKWRSIDEFDVVGAHLSKEAAANEKKRLRERIAELEMAEKRAEKGKQ